LIEGTIECTIHEYEIFRWECRIPPWWFGLRFNDTEHQNLAGTG
jgi:hypothetical protein